MSSKTGLSMEYEAAVVLFEGDFDRLMLVIRFIRLTAEEEEEEDDSFFSLLLFDGWDDEPFNKNEKS